MTTLEEVAERLRKYSDEEGTSPQKKADLIFASQELKERQRDHDLADAAARRLTDGDPVE